MPSVQGLPGIPGGPVATDQVLVSRAGVAYNMPIGDFGYLQFASVVAVRANIALTPSFQLLGFAGPGDGAQGSFVYVATDTTSADNGGSILVDAAGHRYYRQTDRGSASIIWFGAKSDAQMITTNISMAVGSPNLYSSVACFSLGDVGKSIAVTRTDTLGWCPWWGSATGYSAVPKIIQYISATEVVLNVSGGSAPPGSYGSWPYANTPSILTWGTDNGPAINAALVAFDEVEVPDGNWAVATQILLKTRNTLFCARNGGKLFNLGVVNAGATSQFSPLFINTYWRTTFFSGWPAAYGGNAAIQAASGDFDITIDNLEIEMSQAGRQYGGLVSRFLFLQNGKVSNLRVTGNPLVGYECPNLQACDSVTISDCRFSNTISGINPWGGCTHITVSRNTFILPQITTPDFTYTSAQPLAIGFNAIGYSSDQPSRWIDILDNTIYLNGSANTGQGVTGIYLWPDGPESFLGDCRIERNTIICTGNNNFPIELIACGINNSVKDNIIVGADGVMAEPIKVFNQTAQPGTVGTINSVTTTNASYTASVSWTNHGFKGVSLASSEFFFTAAGGPTAGGVYISGYFPIVSVTDANDFIIQLPTAANSSGTTAWNGAFAQIQGATSGTTIEGNKLRDCKSAINSKALIYVEGFGNIIKGNDASFSTPPASVPYVAIVGLNGYGNARAHLAIHNTGPTGSGSLGGYSGNNRVLYGAAVPLIVDPDDVASLLRLQGISANSYSASGGSVVIDASGNVTPNSLSLANAKLINLKDASGNTGYFVLQGDNNFFLYSTNGSGGVQAVLKIPFNTASPIVSFFGVATYCSGVLISGGAGAPNGSTTGSAQPGSIYARNDGSVGSRIYIAQGSGSWAAIAGV